MGRLKGKFQQEAEHLLGLLATMPADVTNSQLIAGMRQSRGQGGARQIVRYLQYLQTKGQIRINRHRYHLPNGDWANRRSITVIQKERVIDGYTENQVSSEVCDAPRLETLGDGAAHYVTGKPTGW